MAFPYKHVLLIGATAGIGRAMADRLVQDGVTVTAVGRRKERLDEFVSKHGESKAKAIQFDITKLDETPKFASDVMKASPDIDCVFLNAGVQGAYNFSNPETIDMTKFNSEINTNFTAIVALAHAFLPFLQSKKEQTSFIFTGSYISVIPATTFPAYSASKAALNVFTLCLRDQLEASGSTIKVIELLAPPVQTEIHDHIGVEAGRKFGMPLDAFTEEAYAGLCSGKDEINLGRVGFQDAYEDIAKKRRATFDFLSGIMRKNW